MTVELTQRFRKLHQNGCFVIPNPWDELSARLLASCGFQALASTSSGYAASLGRKDGAGLVSRGEALRHAARLSEVSGLPVTVDAEDGYGRTPKEVAQTVAMAASLHLAGISIEDSDPTAPNGFRSFDDAADRIDAAVNEARRHGLVLTARADGNGIAYDFNEVLRRLKRFAELGADVVYAPRLENIEQLQTICRAVDKPVNHVVGFGIKGLSFNQIAEAGARRISLGGSFTRAALAEITRLGEAAASGDLEPFERAPDWSRIFSSEASNK